MPKTCDHTYEEIYFSLWETAQRYGSFTQFRVIGNSHDERMIPMLEIGNGQEVIFCIAGLHGTDRMMPLYLSEMALELCRAYECHWELGDLYDVKDLLDEMRICLIPLLNPDGYEICEKGYGTVRNPIFRQMLKMQNMDHREFLFNARGMDVRTNFPTAYMKRKRICQEPASENETKALIRILQEYKSQGLLYFCHSGKRIIYFRQAGELSHNQRSYYLARHLQKQSSYHLEKRVFSDGNSKMHCSSTGTMEQYYAETCKQPVIRIETPCQGEAEKHTDPASLKNYQEIHLLPLEYIFSLVHG